ncbi:MAPEG family protein [Pandoraea sp.]|uniref:MAPEG family protein n=1 Tax=Pandoraea sp. TaxID=1883445 RepID=UPI001D1CC249|nr:MAPEG family protein [Pandoraea sp.]MBU6492938.1 MAPEG family protein [Burkholderiales bacterium]MDE2609308.1 MAPEG family protein [Burkholderiales bacterium]
MNHQAILWPVAALVLLNMIVCAALLRERFTEFAARRLNPQTAASRANMAKAMLHTQAADNYQNLFEAPVLFIAAALAAYVTHQADHWLLLMAWLYVALRYAHSAIHLTYNNVMHRFWAYGTSMLVLWAMWATLALHWLSDAAS